MIITGRTKVTNGGNQTRVVVPIQIMEAMHLTKKDSFHWQIDTDKPGKIDITVIYHEDGRMKDADQRITND